MAFLITAIRECITGQRDLEYNDNAYGKRKLSSDLKSQTAGPSEEEIADAIVSTLFSAEKNGHDLKRTLQNQVHTCGWYEGLAKLVLEKVEAAIKAGAEMGGAMKEAYDKANIVVNEFVEEHPVLTAVLITLLAIGVLAILTPILLEILGFGELGPIEGSFAARLQSTFPNVTKGSWFSFFQRLGMTWAKK